jgi:hypothetical protein
MSGSAAENSDAAAEQRGKIHAPIKRQIECGEIHAPDR